MAKDIFSNLPVLQDDPVANLADHSSLISFVHWKEVSYKQVLSMVKEFKNSKIQDVHGIYCFVLKNVIEAIVTQLVYNIW